MRNWILLMSGLVMTAVVWQTAASDEVENPKEKRELLSKHETLAVFEGVNYRLCRGLTSRCPKQCGDSGEFASFSIKKYLKYEEPGQYGDPKQETFLVQVSDYNKMPKRDPKILETVKALKKGDYVLLTWNHDYVTKEGASFPERPIVQLEAINQAKAERMMASDANRTARKASASNATSRRQNPN